MADKEETTRDLWLNGRVEEKSVGEIMKAIVKINRDDDKADKTTKDFIRQPINLYVNTYGGYMYDKYALVDIILKSKTPVHTIALGKVMSAGIAIMLAGHKRFGNKHSSYLIHNCHGGAYGSPNDVKLEAESMQRLVDMMTAIILERSEFPADLLERIYREKEDYEFGSEEALTFKLIDEIL